MSDDVGLVQVAAAQSLHLAWSLLPSSTSLSLLLGDFLFVGVAFSKVAVAQERCPV